MNTARHPYTRHRIASTRIDNDLYENYYWVEPSELV